MLIPDPKLKSNILEGLVQEIVWYKLYATDKHSWRGSNLKASFLDWERLPLWICWMEMQLEKQTGNLPHSPEKAWVSWDDNKLSQAQTEGKSSPAFGIKKTKRSEVNYCPPYPTGESERSIESVRMELVSDVKNKNMEKDGEHVCI